MCTWGVELWDAREVLEKHTHNGIEFLDKCANFVKERIRIEQEYAKSLRRLVKQYQFKKKEEDDLPYTYQHSFKNFLQENDDFAGQREVIAEEMHNNILKEMQKLSLESKVERKKTLQKMTEHKYQLDHHHKLLLGAKKKYDQASEDANTALKAYETTNSSLESTKAQILKSQKTSQEKGNLAEKARDDYKVSLESFNGKQTLYYDGEIPQIINSELQEPEEKRIEKLSLFLHEYAAVQQRVAPIIAKCYEGMIAAANICDPSQDSLSLIERNQTGELHPGDLEFEEYGKPTGSTTSLAPHKIRINKPSIWAKKKEVLTNDNIANDYADLPPAQRKIKFNKAVSSLQDDISQLEKEKEGMVKIKETSEKFGGDIVTIKGQIEANDKKMERAKSLLHQYQCYLGAAIDNDTARRNSRPQSVEVNSTQAPTAPTPVENTDDSHFPPPPPASESDVDEFDDDVLRYGTVIYDFKGSNDSEMTVSSGEELVIPEDDDGSGWTRVIRSNGDEGYIPTAYIQQI